jgi:hypothetical protein
MTRLASNAAHAQSGYLLPEYHIHAPVNDTQVAFFYTDTLISNHFVVAEFKLTVGADGVPQLQIK